MAKVKTKIHPTPECIDSLTAYHQDVVQLVLTSEALLSELGEVARDILETKIKKVKKHFAHE